MPSGHGGQLRAGVGLQLVQQRGDVGLDSVGGDEQCVGDGLVGAPFGHKRQHFPLPRAERVGQVRSGIRCPGHNRGSTRRVCQHRERLVQNHGHGAGAFGGKFRRQRRLRQRRSCLVRPIGNEHRQHPSTVICVHSGDRPSRPHLFNARSRRTASPSSAPPAHRAARRAGSRSGHPAAAASWR